MNDSANNTETAQVIVRRRWTRVMCVDAALPADLADALWKVPTSLVDMGEPLRKVGTRCTVRLDWSGASYVLKHYVEPTFRHAMKQTISRSRAYKTWLAGHRLADAGINTPRPVACVENRLGPFRGDSFLLYPYVEGQTLKSFLRSEGVQARRRINDLREQVSDFWCRLTSIRISLADTNLKNFILGDAGQLWVIDVDKAKFHRLSYAAAKQHQRGWQQFHRSATRTGNLAARLVEEMPVGLSQSKYVVCVPHPPYRVLKWQ